MVGSRPHRTMRAIAAGVERALLHWRNTALRAPQRDAEWTICQAPFDPHCRVCLLQAPRVEPATCPICVQRNSAIGVTRTPVLRSRSDRLGVRSSAPQTQVPKLYL
jgi:hypothetical protein